MAMFTLDDFVAACSKRFEEAYTEEYAGFVIPEITGGEVQFNFPNKPVEVKLTPDPSRAELAADIYARIIDWGANFRGDAKRYREWQDLVVMLKSEKSK